MRGSCMEVLDPQPVPSGTVTGGKQDFIGVHASQWTVQQEVGEGGRDV